MQRRWKGRAGEVAAQGHVIFGGPVPSTGLILIKDLVTLERV